MQEMELKDEVRSNARKGVAWTGAAQCFTQGSDFLVGVLMARLLVPSDFGVVSASMVFISLISIINSFGIATSLIQRAQLDEGYVRSAQTAALGIGVFSSTLMLLLAPAIAGFYGLPSVEKVVRVLSVMFVIASFNSIPSALLARRMAFREIGTASIAGSVAYAAVALSLALSGCGFWSLVFGPLASMLTATCFLSFFARHRPRFGISPGHAREMFSFGGYLTGSSVLNHIARNGDNLIIGRWLGSGALGLYSRAYNLATLPKEVLVSVFGSVLLPSFATLQHDSDSLRKAYLKSAHAISLISLPASLGLFLIAPELITVVYGAKWGAAIRPLQILSLSGFFYALYIPCTSILLGLGEIRTYAKLQLLYSSGVVLLVLATFRYGIDLVAAGVLGAIVASYFCYACTVHRLLGVASGALLRVLPVPAKAAAVLSLSILAVKMLHLLFPALPNFLLLFCEVAAALTGYLLYLVTARDAIAREILLSLAQKFGTRSYVASTR